MNYRAVATTVTAVFFLMITHQHQGAVQHQSFKHQKGACWYIDMEDDAVHTTPPEA